jgi:hypothetical protein
MLGEICIYPVNEVPGADVLSVTLATTDWREGRINLDEAQAMAASNTARWVGEPPSRISTGLKREGASRPTIMDSLEMASPMCKSRHRKE